MQQKYTGLYQRFFPDKKIFSLPNLLVLSYTLFLAGYFSIPNAVDLYKFYVVALFVPGLFIAWQTLSSLRGSRLLYTILLYMAYTVSTSLWSADFSFAYLWDASCLTAYVLVFILITVFIRDRDPIIFDNIFKIICLLAAIAAIVSIVIWYSENAFPYSRLVGTGTLRNPNPSSFAYGFFCFLSCYYAIKADSTAGRIAFLTACLVLLVFVALTQSRGGGLATLASISLLLLYNRRHQRVIAVIAVLTILAGAIYLLTPPELLSHQLTRGLPVRPLIWTTVLDQVSNAPLFGNGFHKEILVDASGKPLLANFAHNALLASARDGGLIGLALHILILIAAVHKALQVKRENLEAFYLALLLFGFICMSFDSDQLITRPKMLWIIFWLPLAMILSTERNPHKKPAASTRDQQ